MQQVVVLNADYSFLNLVSWKKAFKMLAKDKVEVLKWAEECIKYANGEITTNVPSIMKLIKFIRTIYKNKVPFSKKNVMVRDGFACSYCNEKRGRLTIDHIVPKSKGGKSTFENCVTACKPCNNKKGDRLCSEARMFPSGRPYQPTISEFLMLKMRTLGIQKVIEELFAT